MRRTPVEGVQESFSGQVDARQYEENGNKQAENRAEFPKETNLLLLVILYLNQSQRGKTNYARDKRVCAPGYTPMKSL